MNNCGPFPILMIIAREQNVNELIPSNVLGVSFVNDWRRFQVGIFVQVYLKVRGFQTEKIKQIIRIILLFRVPLY